LVTEFADTVLRMLRARVFACRGAALFLSAFAVACWLPATSFARVPIEKGAGPLSPTLEALAKPSVRVLPPAGQARAIGVAPSGPGSLLRRGNRVLVYIRFDHGAIAALPLLREAGAQVLATSSRYQRVTAEVQPAQLAGVAAVARVAAVTQVRAPILRAFTPCEGGSVVSEGVTQLHAQEAREAFNVEGEGVTVGVLSDSLNQANEAVSPAGPVATKEPRDIFTKDLPGKRNTCPGQGNPVEDLQDYEQGPEEEDPFDEGRAMLQIVHDLAPKADLAFNSAFNGELAFAEGIENLAKPVSEGGAEAKAIVDDVGYFEEPFFQDGPVAAAVNKVAGDGVTYLSAAGNDNLFDAEGNEIASWEAPKYRDSGACPQEVAALSGFNATHCMDFNPGPATDRTFGIKVEPGEALTVDLQWAEPWEGVKTDLDAFLLDANGKLLTGSTEANVSPKAEEGTQEPVEIVQWTNENSTVRTVQLVVNRFLGSAKPRLKFILLENGSGVSGTEYPKSGGGDVVGPSIYGHAGAAGAIAVGAVRYEPREGEEEGPEPYSSRGPVTHYFEAVEGTTPAAELSSPEELSKPEVAATDCGKTTFFAVEPETEPGIWRFCGTSAAAPHAAGVAALMLEDRPSSSPEDVREALADTAEPFSGFGPCAQGGGPVEAVGALEAIEGASFPAAETCEPPKSPEGQVFVAPGNWGAENPPSPPPPTPQPQPEPQPQPKPEPVAPSTSVAKHPPKVVRTSGRSVRLVFRFSSDQSDATFLCKVDSSPFAPCGAQLSRRFKPGSHVVKVRARGASGLLDPTPAIFSFRVLSVR
jgi:subtilisin family serine protease